MFSPVLPSSCSCLLNWYWQWTLEQNEQSSLEYLASGTAVWNSCLISSVMENIKYDRSFWFSQRQNVLAATMAVTKIENAAMIVNAFIVNLTNNIDLNGMYFLEIDALSDDNYRYALLFFLAILCELWEMQRCNKLQLMYFRNAKMADSVVRLLLTNQINKLRYNELLSARVIFKKRLVAALLINST